MCGIAGFFVPGKPVDEGVARHMANRIAHRGPDFGATWIDSEAGVALAHRRLAIIDLSEAGQQPMLSADTRFSIVFNGEIYNHAKLREQLRDEGYTSSWKGRSDTEVLLAALVHWGVEEGLKRVNGMFALALWDRRDRTLWLARDRLGEKPLYYGALQGCLLFGSELKALAAHPIWTGEVNREALSLYLRFGYVPEPHSVFADFFKLPAGHFIKISADDVRRLPQSKAYWALAEHVSGPRRNATDTELVDELEKRLLSSVGSRMEADVGLGAFLSGGIDSSLVVALMQAQSQNPIHTFTIGFDVPGYNEAAMAKNVARHLGTHHTELYVSPQDALEIVPDLPHIWDEPFADSSQMPTLILSRLTRKSVTVALSGDGGDEFFGGYNRYGNGYASYKKMSALPASVRAGAATLLQKVPAHAIDRLIARLPGSGTFPAVGDRMQKLGRVLSAPDIATFYSMLVSKTYPDLSTMVLGGGVPLALADRKAEWPQLDDPRELMMYLDALSYLPGDIMTKVDRATMAHSLESRAPFLDHDLVEFAWSLPMSVKIKNGKTKWALREVLARHVPRDLFERPKMGFGIPIEHWLTGPLRDWASDLLDSRRIRSQGILDPKQVTQIWEDHLAGRGRWHHELWTILMLQSWLETDILKAGPRHLIETTGAHT